MNLKTYILLRQMDFYMSGLVQLIISELIDCFTRFWRKNTAMIRDIETHSESEKIGIVFNFKI